MVHTLSQRQLPLFPLAYKQWGFGSGTVTFPISFVLGCWSAGHTGTGLGNAGKTGISNKKFSSMRLDIHDFASYGGSWWWAIGN